MIIGGGQEGGIRSGTENLFGIKVFEYAGKMHYQSIRENYKFIKELNQKFRSLLNPEYFTIISSENASPYILTISAKGLRGEVIMHSLENKGIIVGNGSACSSKNRFSRVLESAGYKEEVLDGVVRISFSTENTMDEIIESANAINEVVKRLKGII